MLFCASNSDGFSDRPNIPIPGAHVTRRAADRRSEATCYTTAGSSTATKNRPCAVRRCDERVLVYRYMEAPCRVCVSSDHSRRDCPVLQTAEARHATAPSVPQQWPKRRSPNLLPRRPTPRVGIRPRN